MDRISFDTTFLIDLQREKKHGPSKAHAFLQAREATVPCLSMIAAGEYAEGFSDPRDPSCLLMIDSFDLLPFDRAVFETYSRIARLLRQQGNLIGGNDLWIGANALAAHLPLVTRNAAEFQRIPDLVVLSY